MYQALYRKYRPQSFDDVCGQEAVTSVLRYETQNDRVSHAYLFCGPRGTGKTTCAKILAKAVNCLSPENGNPCGKCSACRSIDAGAATDVVEMDAASNNGVDYIRDIREAVVYTPSALKKRVYIIDEVHMLSSSAFNALLKTLEEPPEHVLFILATTEMHKLPATIISRCQRFDFRRIKVDVLADRLHFIAQRENVSLDDEAAKVIAKQAMGGMRDAVSLFELCASGGHAVTAERVRNILGLSGTETAYKTAVAVKRRDIAAIFHIVQTATSSSRDIAVYWQELLEFWRSMLVCKYLPPDARADYLDMTEPELRVLDDAAKRFDAATLRYHFTILDEALWEMNRFPQNKRLTAELSLIKMSDPSMESTVEALTARVAALENRLAMAESGGAVAKESERASAELLAEFPVGNSAETSAAEASAEKSVENPVENSAEIIAEQSPAGVPEGTESAESLIPIRDTGEVAEKIAETNPIYMSFFRDASCYVSPDRKEITVKTVSPFAAQMLSADDAKKVLSSAFVRCGVCAPDVVLHITAGGAPRSRAPIDELTEF